MHKIGLGISVGFSDPVFMARFGLEPENKLATFPYEPAKFDKLLKERDKEAERVFKVAYDWMSEISSGGLHRWEDVAFLRKNWEGPLVLKGIQCVAVCGERKWDSVFCLTEGIVVGCEKCHGRRRRRDRHLQSWYV